MIIDELEGKLTKLAAEKAVIEKKIEALKKKGVRVD